PPPPGGIRPPPAGTRPPPPQNKATTAASGENKTSSTPEPTEKSRTFKEITQGYLDEITKIISIMDSETGTSLQAQIIKGSPEERTVIAKCIFIELQESSSLEKGKLNDSDWKFILEGEGDEKKQKQ